MYLFRSLSAVLLTLHLAGMGLATAFSASLRYDRRAVNDGEAWRLLTGGFAHVNGEHLLLNAGGLLLLAVLTPAGRRARALALLPLTSGLVFAVEHLVLEHAWAAGLSGALAAWSVGLMAGLDWKAAHFWVGAIALVKALSENALGGPAAVGTFIGVQVLVQHHLAGACLGVSFVLRDIARRYIKRKNSETIRP